MTSGYSWFGEQYRKAYDQQVTTKYAETYTLGWQREVPASYLYPVSGYVTYRCSQCEELHSQPGVLSSWRCMACKAAERRGVFNYENILVPPPAGLSRTPDTILGTLDSTI